MESSESDLALAAAAGDRAAFAALAERVYERTLRLAFRLTGARAEAEDLTQDVLCALPARLGSFRGEAAFSTWLYRVVINAAQDRRRRIGRQARLAQGWGDWEVARRAELAEAAEAADWLSTAMRALPDDLRDTVALVFDGLTHGQAAQVLDVSEGTISWRMSEVKRRLRALKEAEE